MTQVAQNLAEIRAEIADAAQAAHRKARDVQLIAVSKTFAVEDIRPALQAGQRVFGENRVQEAGAKWPELRSEFEGIELHLIGPLQSNKTKEAVALFDVIHTVDREKIARSLAFEIAAQNKAMQLYVQVNTGEEPQKAGINPQQCTEFVAFCQNDLKLPIVGLMCIPPVEEEAALHFNMLVNLAKRVGLRGLSMGMSGDYSKAVRYGATAVRVGSAVFGSRG
jgi:pyridoxal phosphate enzyme (YggS family)